MQFDPKFSFWFGVAITALIGLGSGTVSLTNALPADWIPYVIAWTKILSFFGSGLLTAMHGYSSGNSGPFVTPSAATPMPTAAPVAPNKVPAIALLIASTALLGLLSPGTAYAQFSNVPPMVVENYVGGILLPCMFAAFIAGIVVGQLTFGVWKMLSRLFLGSLVALAAAMIPIGAHAQALQAPAAAPVRIIVHHRAHVPLPRPQPSAAALDAFAAVTTPATPVPAGKLSTTTVQQNPLALLQKFSIDDLNAALLDAQGQNPPDTTAINCYTALIPIVQSNIANPLPAGPGAFQLAQKVRDFKALTANLQSPTGPLASLNQACAAWVLDGVNTFLGLGAQLGLVVGTGGLGGALPAIGGLGLLPFKLP